MEDSVLRDVPEISLLEQQDEHGQDNPKQIYPLGISIDGTLMMTEVDPPPQPVYGKWKRAHLVSQNRELYFSGYMHKVGLFRLPASL